MPDNDRPATAPEASAFSYLFEAKGIGRYILDSGQLRDVIGASDLVADLCAAGGSDLLDTVAAAAGGGFRFSRRASAAFCAHGAPGDLDRLRALWRLAFGLTRPGLEASDAPPVAGATDIKALQKAYAGGSGVRFNGSAELLPAGHPFTLFNPRSGRVATALQVYPGEGGDVGQGDVQILDTLTAPQRAWAEAGIRTGTGPAARVLTEGQKGLYRFPRNLDDSERDRRGNPVFPFRGGDHRVAVVHADLSGLGEVFMGVTDAAKVIADVTAVAEAIEAAVLAAARKAMTDEILNKIPTKPEPGATVVAPARPVLIGGDDLTFIVRADLALAFTRTLLEGIETETRQRFAALRADRFRGRADLLDGGLSACAGIAVVGRGHPFLLASDLAEDLCKHAKDVAKDRAGMKGGVKAGAKRTIYPSLLAFHPVTTSLGATYAEIRERELMGGALTANPYVVGDAAERGVPGATSYARLDEARRALALMPRGRGKLIEALRHLPRAAAHADAVWRRWCEVADLDEESDGYRALAAALGGSVPGSIGNVAGLISDALEAVDLNPDEKAPAP